MPDGKEVWKKLGSLGLVPRGSEESRSISVANRTPYKPAWEDSGSALGSERADLVSPFVQEYHSKEISVSDMRHVSFFLAAYGIREARDGTHCVISSDMLLGNWLVVMQSDNNDSSSLL